MISLFLCKERTAVACTRALVAILENYQQEDGSVVVPEVLRPMADAVAPFAPQLAVGSSGTFESIATMCAIARDGTAPSSLNQSVLREPEQEAVSLFATERRLLRLRSTLRPGARLARWPCSSRRTST